jgi:hypothetical protein
MRDFFEYYKNDTDILKTDAFYCSFPPAMCELYLPFNRSIIINAAHRIFLGRCSKNESHALTERLKMMSAAPTGVRHFLSASNSYDAEYLKFFTGLEVPVISGSSFGYQYCQYKKVRDEIVVGPLQRTEVPAFLNSTKFDFHTLKSLYGKYKVEDICKHSVFIMIPYAVHSYGISEVYSLSVPIVAPSIELALRWGLFSDKNTNDNHYCGDAFEHPVWNSGSQPYSPEDRSEAAQQHWLQFADIYEFPYIQYFDSLEQLEKLLETLDFNSIHMKMAAYNRQRRTRIYSQVYELTRRVSHRGAIFDDFNDAMVPWRITSTL